MRTERIDDGTEPDNAVTLLFPEIHDLCAQTLTVAATGGFGRRSERAFSQALGQHGHVDLDVLDERADRLPDRSHPSEPGA